MPINRRIFLQSTLLAPYALNGAAAQKQRVRFVLHDVDEFEGLPRGAVSSYSVGVGARHLSTQPLALFATRPRQAALSPDGAHLVVAAYGGGSYNVLPVSAEGLIGPVRQVWKELGSGPHPELQRSAHPHSVVFHPSGKWLFTTDFGADRISVFSFEDGAMLNRSHWVAARAGSGPAGLYLSDDGGELTIDHRLSAGVHRLRFDSRMGRLR